MVKWKLIGEKIYMFKYYRKGYGTAYHRCRELCNCGYEAQRIFNEELNRYDIYIRPQTR